jgi:hypothetical protein
MRQTNNNIIMNIYKLNYTNKEAGDIWFNS